MIILETVEPNFALQKDITILTECGKSVYLSYGEYVSISKIDENDYCLSNCLILPKELKERFFKEFVNNIDHVSIEDLDSDDLNTDGMKLKEFLNTDFVLDQYEFPKFEENENTIFTELKRISSLN